MKTLLLALEKKLEGEVAVAKANVEVYLNQSVGIGEHPDLVGAIEEQLVKLAEAEEKLSSSCIAVPLTPVLITGDVSVLFVIVDVPLSTNAFTDCWEGGKIAESDAILSSSTTGVAGPTYVEPTYTLGVESEA